MGATRDLDAFAVRTRYEDLPPPIAPTLLDRLWRLDEAAGVAALLR